MTSVGDWLLKLRGQRPGDAGDPATIPRPRSPRDVLIEIAAGIAALRIMLDDQTSRLADTVQKQAWTIEQMRSDALALRREIDKLTRHPPVSDTDFGRLDRRR